EMVDQRLCVESAWQPALGGTFQKSVEYSRPELLREAAKCRLLKSLTTLRSVDLFGCVNLQNADALKRLTALTNLSLGSCAKLANVDGLKGPSDSSREREENHCGDFDPLVENSRSVKSTVLSAGLGSVNVTLRALFVITIKGFQVEFPLFFSIK